MSIESVIVEADGGSRGNPGPAGYGAVVRDAESGEVLAERKEFIGTDTNNVAEYRGLIAGLAAAAELGAHQVAVRMDSKLVIEQMSGRWQVKHPSMRPLARQAAELAGQFAHVSYQWIPRAQNGAADRLANEAMDAGRRAEQAAGSATGGGGRLPVSQPALTDAAATFGDGAVLPENNNAAWIAADSEPTRFILVRHGVTEYSVSRRFAGRSDLDLTAEGLQQARQAAERVAELGEVSAVYASPLLRTRHTAEVLAARLGLDVQLEDGLVETDFGDWDGYTFDEIRKKWPQELSRWLVDPAFAPPVGESLEQTARRVRRARDRILSRQPGTTVALVTHVSPIKALVQSALGAPPAAVHRMYLAPASISVIDYFVDGPVSLRSYNETGHLRAG